MSLNPHPPDTIDTIIDDKVEWIEKDLKKRGLNYDRLIEDVLDHVCCLVEEEMISGKDFKASYSGVMGTIGENRLPEIEHQTLLMLNKKFQQMKKFTYFTGLASAILILFGSLSKMMHWPGAGIELTLGLLAIILVFLPLYFIVTHRERPEKKNIIYPVVGYLTVASLLAGAIFKIQHWPGANSVVTASLVILFIGFLPLYLVHAFRKAEGEKIGLPYIVMLMVGIGLAVLTFNVRMAKDVIDEYKAETVLTQKNIAVVTARNLELLSIARDEESPMLNQIEEIHQRSEELRSMIDEMLEELLVSIKEPGVNIEDLRKADKTGVGREVIVDNGWARRFMDASYEYQSFLSEIIDDPVIIAQIAENLQYTTQTWFNEWGYREVIYDAVIKIYYKNTDVALGIALSELAAVNHLINKDIQ
jgi:hypothetical protein